MKQLRILSVIVLVAACNTAPKDKKITKLEPAAAAEMAQKLGSQVTPTIAEGLSLKLWGVDTLVADPVSLDVDDDGTVWFTRTNRQKNAEFDIRGHQEWEIPSIALRDIEEKRAFLHKVLAPEFSKQNEWIADLNNDGSHDWKDMTIEKENVYALKDLDGDGVADQAQLAVEDFNDEVTDAAGGVMKFEDNLYFNVGPDMWRLHDKDGDGLMDEKTSMSHGYGIHIGFSGHGMSGIEVGPDGKIYWQIGDIGFNGTGPDGKKYDFSNSGVVVRANPDGSDFEVFAYGNRNTHEFVFDEYGNMISEDNDGDHPGESERIVYIVDGGDIGWRANWQYGKYRDPENNTYKVWMDEKMAVPRWDGQAAYFLPPIANFVNGPTGMLYNPGTALSPEWNKTFFIVEFVGNPARSGIHTFKLNPKGASFELGESKKMLGGVLATGIDFGPDGAMYVADWIDGWGTKDRGRVWKLDVTSEPTAERKQTQTYLQVKIKDISSEELGTWLKWSDMRVRQRAQFELVKRGGEGLDQLKKAIAQTDHQLARVHGIWGIAQMARKDIQHAALLVPLLNDADPEIQAQAARWIGDVRYGEAGDQLIPLLRSEYARTSFFAAEALGRTANANATQPLIQLLEYNDDEDIYIRHAASLALARIGDAEVLGEASSHLSRAVRTGAVLALRRMQHPNVARFLSDPDEYVAAEAARAINDDMSIEAALPALGDALLDYRFKSEALIRRAINANVRVGSAKSLQNLVSYIRHEGSPAAMRVEAIAAVSGWAKPSVLDRVDGRYRGEVTRNGDEAKTAASDVLKSLMKNSDATVRLASAKAIGKMKIDGGDVLFAALKSDKDPSVKAESLKSLSAIKYKNIDQAISLALADKEKSVRVTALDLLATADMSKELMVKLLTEVINTRTTEERQAALTTLGSLPVDLTNKVFDELLNKYEKGSLPAEVYLELADAVDSTKSVSLVSRFKEISKNMSVDSLGAAFAGALMGGDANKGRNLFYRHQTAQCIRCHAYDDYGGSAGPRLNGVAGRISRQQILEALVNPDARLAPGFGTVKLELKNGKTVSGILQDDKETTVSLKIGDRPDTVVLKSDIAKRTNAASSMPAMRYILTKKEIRDVVAFLATLNEE